MPPKSVPNKRSPKRSASRRQGKPSIGARTRKGHLRVRFDVVRHVLDGHPWLYREALSNRNPNTATGDSVTVADSDGNFLAHGVYDAESNIAVRLCSWRKQDVVNKQWVIDRVKQAVSFRQRSRVDTQTNAYRLIHAEGDSLPGVVADRYGDFILIQQYTKAAGRWIQTVADTLLSALPIKGVYLQKRISSLGGKAPTDRSATCIAGENAPVDMMVTEGGLSFVVDVTSPLSTGLFLDLRLGRQRVAELSQGRRVLNLFSYTGAISVYAKKGGAATVTSVDVSPKAHTRSRRNFRESNFDEDEPNHIVGDALSVMTKMASRKQEFDLIIADPPAFANASAGGKVFSAKRNYAELVGTMLDVLAENGQMMLVCSTRKMSNAEFVSAIHRGAAAKGVSLRLEERIDLPTDFCRPFGFAEFDYLKCFVCSRR